MPDTSRALARVSRDGKTLLVLCPLGHLLAHYKLGGLFAGSAAEAEWGTWSAGRETSWDRLASKCDGAGHS